MSSRIEKAYALKNHLDWQRAQRLGCWANGAQPGPFKVTYFPTNRCNLRCAICWQRQDVHDYSELTPSRQSQLIEEAHHLDVREFVIGGGGEPLCSWNNLKHLVLQRKVAPAN